MKRTIILFLSALCTIAVQGQNQLDERGRKTGPWKVESPEGNTLYEATFVEGEPVGQMVRYYESGAVRARMIFEPGKDRSYTELFYENGEKAAEGLYVKKEKDSVWTYYSEFDGTVRIRESYLEGKLHGKAIRYYPSGVISEEITWDRDHREGPWNQYFEDGSLRLKGHYRNNHLNGPYEVYSGASTLMMSGAYLDNQSTGTWSYFDEKGNLIYTLEFKDGKPVDSEQYYQILQDTLRRYDTIHLPQTFQ